MVLLCVLKHDSCRSRVKDRHIVSNIYYFSARFGYNWIKKKKIMKCIMSFSIPYQFAKNFLKKGCFQKQKEST